MRHFVPIFAVVCGLFCASALAAPGDPASGKQKAADCEICHGKDGVSPFEVSPSLAGQHDKFLQWQLVFFRSGRRVSDSMTDSTKDLTDADIRDLGAYYASLPRFGPIESKLTAEQLQAGEKTIAYHRCASCHGDRFEGTDSVPVIKHQHKEYLIKALQDYRATQRPSIGVAAMIDAAASLSDTDIAVIAAYLEQFP